MRRSAVFDASKRYRYRLGREWDATLPQVTFVLLNPSTADHRKDDPTIRRCIGFARAWGYGSVEVLNLFAWRATKPKDLLRATAPVGSANDRHLRVAARRSARVIVAWGIHGAWQNRDQAALALLRRHGCLPFCLGLTRDGLPRHVLYLRHETSPTEYPSDARR